MIMHNYHFTLLYTDSIGVMVIVTSILLVTILSNTTLRYAMVCQVMLAFLLNRSPHKQITLPKPHTLTVPNMCSIQQSADFLYSDKSSYGVLIFGSFLKRKLSISRFLVYLRKLNNACSSSWRLYPIIVCRCRICKQLFQWLDRSSLD